MRLFILARKGQCAEVYLYLDWILPTFSERKSQVNDFSNRRERHSGALLQAILLIQRKKLFITIRWTLTETIATFLLKCTCETNVKSTTQFSQLTKKEPHACLPPEQSWSVSSPPASLCEKKGTEKAHHNNLTGKKRKKTEAITETRMAMYMSYSSKQLWKT